MRILAIADEESKALWDFYIPDRFKDVDVIVACGDLRAEYLEFLVTMTGIPLLYVPGNHDAKYLEYPPEGCICIDGKVHTVNGVRFLGFGGSMKYSEGPYMHTEKEMTGKVRKAKNQIIKNGGFDILITHAPCKGYGDLDDLAHRGFNCFNELLYRIEPPLMFHGHVHNTYQNRRFVREMRHPSGTVIVNCVDKYYYDFNEAEVKKMTRSETSKKLRGAFNPIFGSKVSERSTTGRSIL